jgi:ribosomal-protein-alanine N-acetyltransferase
MDRHAAERVITWRYEPPYDVYNMDASALPDLLAREHHYYVASMQDDDLVGFCCFGPDARVSGGDYSDAEAVDVGIGLRPDLTGQGLGASFLSAVLDFGQEALGATRFRATIAAFNTRSIRVAEGAGFAWTSSFKRTDEMGFVQMLLGC